MAVTGGACSAPLTVSAGQRVITEQAAGLPAGDTVSSITVSPSSDLLSDNLAARTVKIDVRSGSTVKNETVVHYTNKVAPAQLKICKVGINGLAGTTFTFTENGGTPFSVVAGTPTAPNCSALKTFQVGTNVNVAELATPGDVVQSIVVQPAAAGSNNDPTDGTVSVSLNPGVTVVTYTNKPFVPPSTGYVEICKQASDQFVTGSFQFTINPAPTSGSATLSVAVGQCSPAINVPSGDVTVTEAQKAPYFLSDVYTVPSSDLVSQNDTNGTATVNVVAGGVNTETQVNFVNDTSLAEVKICKTLTANSSALAGQTFWFDISSADGSSRESIVAGQAGSTVCQLATDQFGDIEFLPVGSTVSISEEGQNDVLVTSVVVSPSSQDNGSYPPTANLTVGPGITQANFTNMAEGQIEICKAVTTYAPTNESFSFVVNGVTISVPANTCTQPITVPAGSATITENQLPNWVLQGVTVNGSGSLTSLNGTTASVTVPFGGDTAVTFTNTIATGQFKICKVVPANESGILTGPYTIDYSYTANGTTVTGSDTMNPGQCSLIHSLIPVLDPNGNPTQITTTEEPSANSYVSNITVSNGSVVSSNPPVEVFTLLPNPTNAVTVVTYTNSFATD